jgi:hypothetical protein
MNCHSTHHQSISTGTFSRRAALHGAAGAGLAVALIATTRAPGVQAQATPGSAAEGTTPPNHFVLSNGETRITYDTGDITGEPQLTYQGPVGFGPIDERPVESVTIAGDGIHAEEVLYLNQLITGYLGAAPDAATFYLTLLLPDFNGIGPEADPIPFATLAILTTQLTSIAGPALIEGALQEYAVLELEGPAELVMS